MSLASDFFLYRYPLIYRVLKNVLNISQKELHKKVVRTEKGFTFALAIREKR